MFAIAENNSTSKNIQPIVAETGTLAIIQGNALLPVYQNQSYAISSYILRVLIGEDDINVVLRDIGEKNECLYAIIKCESNFENICNQRYGCGSGIGIAQIIPNTVKHCEEKLGRKLNPLNELDNLECAIWLLENEGTGHWGFPPDDPRGYMNGVRWGTYDCFKDYCL